MSAPSEGQVWLVGHPPDGLEPALAGISNLVRHEGVASALHELPAHPPSSILLGEVARGTAPELLAAVSSLQGPRPRVLVCSAAGFGPEPATQRAVYYQLSPSLQPAALRRMLNVLRRPRAAREFLPGGDAVASSEQAFAAARAIAREGTPAGMANAMAREFARLVGAERAHCLLFDDQDGVLWREGAEPTVEFRPPRGLAGWSAVAQEAVLADEARSDPRYASDVDDPPGQGTERLIVQPVCDHRNECHAVLVGVRPRQKSPFDDQACKLSSSLAKAFAPHLSQLSFEIAVSQRARSELAIRLGGPELFRDEAIDAYAARPPNGQVIRVSPRWLDRIFWVVLGTCVWAVLFMVFVRVSTYSEGKGVVRLGRDVEVDAPVSGRVERWLAEPGVRVQRGGPLVQLFAEAERSELERAELDWSAALRAYLVDPAQGSTAALLAAQARRDAQRSSLERRMVFAPHDGVVSEHRVRQGQAVQAGQALTAVIPSQARGYVVAALPGHDKARLQPGQIMRVELEGYERTVLELSIDTVGHEVLAAAEVHGLLGPTAESMELPPAVTMVTAPLSLDRFEANGASYPFSHGMRARAWVEVSSATLLDRMFPAWEGE